MKLLMMSFLLLWGSNLEDTRCCFYCDGRSKCHQTKTQHCSGNQEHLSIKKKKTKQTVFYRLCHVKVVFPLSSELIIEKECHDFETNYFSFRPNLPSSLSIVFLKNLVVIWMRNVPFSLRHLQTWSPVGAV